MSVEANTSRPITVSQISVEAIRDYLSTIGVFIGTHGVAVFLVVYYTMWLYPDAREERGKWLTQISLLREQLTPQTRKASLEQASATLYLAADNFIERLKLILEIADNKFPGTNQSTNGSTSFSIWNETFSLDDAEIPNDPIKDLNDLIERFVRARDGRTFQYRRMLDSAFQEANEADVPTRYTLGRIHFGDGFIGNIWETATSKLRQDWEEFLNNATADSLDRPQVKAFIRFIRKHPSYKNISEETRSRIEDRDRIQWRRVDDLAVDLRARLKKHIDDGIRNAEISKDQ